MSTSFFVLLELIRNLDTKVLRYHYVLRTNCDIVQMVSIDARETSAWKALL